MVVAGIPAEVQRLIYAGRQLEDEQTLAHYAVERGMQLDYLSPPSESHLIKTTTLTLLYSNVLYSICS